MMSLKWFFLLSLILLIGAVCVVNAESFAIQATDDLDVGNDPGLSPTLHEDGDGLHIRNISTRRRVAYIKYDISSLKEDGKAFYDISLNILGTKDRKGPVSVWGVKESLDNIIDFDTLSWTTAPGVLNEPMPALDMPVELDYADLSPVLIDSFDGIANGTRVSTPTNEVLDDFFNADTDGIIVLMLAETGVETANAIIRPVNYTTAGTGYGDPELFGVVLTGEKGYLRRASNPVPENNATITISTTQLSWTLPDPNNPDDPNLIGNPLNCSVYFHEVDDDPNTSDDPNDLLPNYGYTTLAADITDNFVNLPITLQREKTYNWIVDVYDASATPSKSQGRLWTFNTNNIAPVVDAGISQYVWLNNTGDPASATVSIDATAADPDDYPSTYTVAWTQESGPTISISPNDVEDITLVLTQTGTYRLRLTAYDGALYGSDAVQIYVGATPCDAAQAMPGYEAFDGDFNNDCFVNLGDFFTLAEDWLGCNSLMPCTE